MAPAFMEFIYNPGRNNVIHKVKTQMSVIKYCATDYNNNKKKKHSLQENK